MGEWTYIEGEAYALEKVVGDYSATIRDVGNMTVTELRRTGSYRISTTVRFASHDIAKSDSDHLLEILANHHLA